MKVSIIIINYNDKVRVDRAIQSALNQTYRDVEIIVVDDGSDSDTRKLYTKHDVKLIQLERDDKTKRTPSRARNKGIEKATGDYICFLDSDNYYASTFVEEAIKNPVDVMFCDWEIIGLQKQVVTIGDVWKVNNTLLGNYLKYARLDHQCLVIKRSVLDKAGYYDERLPRSQDCDLIVRLMLVTENWKYINKTGFFFEKHEADQMKNIASIHGKTLWTLKNNINIVWLNTIMKSGPVAMLCVNQGINDFCTKKEWKQDYEKSDFKKLKENMETQLKKEVIE